MTPRVRFLLLFVVLNNTKAGIYTVCLRSLESINIVNGSIFLGQTVHKNSTNYYAKNERRRWVVWLAKLIVGSLVAQYVLRTCEGILCNNFKFATALKVKCLSLHT